MSNTNITTSTTTRSPRVSPKMIGAAKAAAELDHAGIENITSRFIDCSDWIAFDKALGLVQCSDSDHSEGAYALRLKIEDLVIEAREAIESRRAAAKAIKAVKPSKVIEVKSAERALAAVELRKAGMTLQAIADELGFKCRQGARSAILRTAGTVNPS